MYHFTLCVLVIWFHPETSFLSKRDSAYNIRDLVGYRSALARVVHDVLEITGSHQDPLTSFAQYPTLTLEFIDLT